MAEQLLNRATRAVLAAVSIVAVLIGVPVLLIAVAAWPLPTSPPDWERMYWAARQGDIPAEFVVKSLACVVWLAWAQIAWALLWELAVNVPRSLRGRSERATPLTVAPATRFARRMVTAAMVLTAITSTPATTVAAPTLDSLRSSTREPQSPDVTSTVIVHVEQAVAAPGEVKRSAWKVESGDTLWDIAERCMGDGSRVDELVACNPHLVPSRHLRPGQIVELPDGVRAPADRVAPDLMAEAERSARAELPENVWIDAPHVLDHDVGVDGGAGLASVARPPTDGGGVAPESPPASAGSVDYVVQPGDSIVGIAEQIAGPDRQAVVDYVEGLIELNLNREMNDGRRFIDPGFINVGWVLQLPDVPVDEPAGAIRDRASASTAIVERGESLWSIAEDRLGAGERWSEIYELNEGRTFDDGRALSDPDLIHPAWDLRLPTDGATDEVDEADGVDDADSSATESVVELEDEPSVEDNAAGSGEVADPDVDAMSPAGNGAADAASSGTVVDSAGLDEPSVPARPDNVWLDGGSSAGAWPAPSGSEPVVTGVDASFAGAAAGATNAVGDVDSPDVEDDHESPDAAGAQLLTLGRAGMLSVGVLMLLAVRRRNQMRRARPNCRLPEPSSRAVAIERSLRSIDVGDRLARVDIAIRHAAMNLVEADARVLAVAVSADGDVELFASGPVVLSAPWELATAPPPEAEPSATRWRLAATTPVELLAEDARRVGAPCPTLVQLGCDVDGRDVFVDLEALEAIEVDATDDDADAVVAAVASTLAASVLAEVTTLVGVGLNDEVFLGHRLYRPARDLQHAFDEAADAIGSTAAAERSTFDLRARVTSGETWEPAVVIVGSAAGTVIPSANRTGLALVSAAPIHGPSSRLAPDGDSWILLPLGIRLTPIGLSPSDVDAIAELASVPEPEPNSDAPADDPDVTLVGVYDHAEDHGDTSVDGDEVVVAPAADALDNSPDGAPAEADSLPHTLIVRLLGPVSVESAGGEVVDFERSKTKELVAWLATHRERSTRSNARAALWELDVRDNTFANVVSEARRALARLVEPPDGEEWVGRTMTEALPLHPLVVTDLDLIEHALDTARLQPPNLAIDTLTPAVELIKGVPFEGTSYLWPDAEGITSQLVMRAITVTNALAAHCLSVGDLEGVFAATSRGLSVIPAHEDMIAVRMRAYAQAGDRAGVRNEWETYERAIVSDPWSDGEPSDRMIQLRQELLS